MYRRSAYSMLGALLFCTTMAACGEGDKAADNANSEDSTLVRAAKKEGQLTWYTSGGEGENQIIKSAFEAKYPGIRINIVRAISGELTARFTTEHQSGKVVADVMSASDVPFFASAQEEGMFEDLSKLDVPGYAEWPEEFTTKACPIVSVNPQGIAYNTDLVDEKDVPESWEDLVQEPLKDNLMLIDLRRAAGYMATAELWYTKISPEFLEEIAEAKPKLIDSLVPGAQAVAAGEAAVIVPAVASYIAPLANEGAPIKFKIMSPTTGAEECVGIPTGASHPNAAKLFTSFFMSDDGQKAIVEQDGKISPVDDGASGLPDGYSSPDFESATANIDKYAGLLGLQ